MEFITKYSDSVLKGTFEVFTRPSLTEPDNAMSIPEIIARFTRGQGVPVDQHPWTSGSAFEDEKNPDDLQGFMELQPATDPATDPATVPANRASIDEASTTAVPDAAPADGVKNQSEGAQ